MSKGPARAQRGDCVPQTMVLQLVTGIFRLPRRYQPDCEAKLNRRNILPIKHLSGFWKVFSRVSGPFLVGLEAS